ncbi:MAG TPA: MMPL family transporter [Mycobacteriales bacterium]|jgi:RND superfamily putative drug exporter|nr:MMPL family transporter [Mycobacteriales bacterium]
MVAEPTNQSVRTRAGLLTRGAQLSVRRPWAVVVAWLAVTVVAGVLSGGLGGRLGAGGFEVPGSQSLRVQEDLQQRFTGQSADATLLVVRSSTAPATDPAFGQVVERLAAGAGSIDDVTSVVTPAQGGPGFVSADGRTAYVVVAMSGDIARQQEIAADLGQLAGSVDTPGFDVTTAGSAAFFDRLNEVSRHDLESAERITFPITLVILVVAFGSVVAAGLPIALAIISLVVTLGALFLLAGVMNMNIFVTNSASIVGIGVGIDYALFVVTRFREELRRGREPGAAVVRSIETSGRAVLLSGLTVIVALAGMFLVDIAAFRSMAVGMMTVVTVAVAAALTLLPALLALLGRRIEKLRVPAVRRRAVGAEGAGFWHRWAVSVMRRPWLSLAGSVAMLLLLSAPFASLRLGQPSAMVLPADEGPRVSAERLAESFGPGISGPVEILVETPGGATSQANIDAVGRLTGSLAADRAVSAVRSLAAPVAVPVGTTDPRSLGAAAPAVAGLVNWDRGADLTRITVVPRIDPSSAAAEQLVERIRGEHLRAAGLQGRAYVGGQTAGNLDLSDEITSRMPWVVALVLGLSFLLLAMAFRSLLLPLKALLMNLMSVAASYGLIVAVFQWGWGEELLGFTSEGSIASFVPLFLFSILFGLSMDYEVFLLSRMREDYLRTGSNELAVAQGLEATARTITSAALIMVTVFAAFASSRVLPFKQMGFGLAVAVFLDAAIIRTVLVPAAMKLMGDWNWWMPRWLDRILPTIELESHEDAPVAAEHAMA